MDQLGSRAREGDREQPRAGRGAGRLALAQDGGGAGATGELTTHRTRGAGHRLADQPARVPRQARPGRRRAGRRRAWWRRRSRPSGRRHTPHLRPHRPRRARVRIRSASSRGPTASGIPVTRSTATRSTTTGEIYTDPATQSGARSASSGSCRDLPLRASTRTTAAAGRAAATAGCATSRTAVPRPRIRINGDASVTGYCPTGPPRLLHHVPGTRGVVLDGGLSAALVAGVGDRRMVRAPRPLRPVDGGDHLPRGPRGARDAGSGRSRCTRWARPAPRRRSAPPSGGSAGRWARRGVARACSRSRRSRRVYALGVLITGLRVPVPQLRRQVPDWWRTFFGRPFAAVLYGAGLGIGFLTYLSDGTLVVVAFAALASGTPGGRRARHGAVRAGARSLGDRRVAIDHQERSRALVDRLASPPDAPRRIDERRRARRDRDRGRGGSVVPHRPPGPGRLRGGGCSPRCSCGPRRPRSMGARRWRRALDRLRLPPALERSAAGRSRWRVARAAPRRRRAAPRGRRLVGRSPRLFSGALVRARRRVGVRVPCGCLGGRGDIDVHVALARNGALLLPRGVRVIRARLRLAVDRVAGLAGAAADALAAALALGALIASALVVWRASVWLGRGNA